MECKKKFPPVKEVSRLVSFIKPLPWFPGGCAICECEWLKFVNIDFTSLFEPCSPIKNWASVLLWNVDTELSLYCTGKLKVGPSCQLDVEIKRIHRCAKWPVSHRLVQGNVKHTTLVWQPKLTQLTHVFIYIMLITKKKMFSHLVVCYVCR